MTAPLTPTPWIDNLGTVPDGVEADTVIEVEYGDGNILIWHFYEGAMPNNTPGLWTLGAVRSVDVIRWRKVQP